MNLTLVDNFFLGSAEVRPSRARLGPHLGLLSLVAVAEAAGHRATLVDPSLLLFRGEVDPGPGAYPGMARAILAREPDAVGFTSLGCNFGGTVRMAAEVRARAPSLPILLGGPHPSVLHREILQSFPQFDVVVRHEAERTLPGLLAALEAGERPRGVPGVTFRDGGEVVEAPDAPHVEDLDTLPMPAWEAWPLAEYIPKLLRVEIGRGCPYDCSFCSTSGFFDRRFRLKSAGRIVAELDHLHRAYGIAHFDLVHDMLTANRAAVLAFCEALGGRGYAWNCSARIDRVDADLLARMRAAGCHEVYYGVETGSPRLQVSLKKRLDLGLVPQVVDQTTALGMHAVVSFITGFPQEDLDDQRATLDLMGDVILRAPPDLSRVLLHHLVPLAGTSLLAEYGAELLFDGATTDRLARAQDDEELALVRRHPRIFVDYHHFPGALPRRRNLAVTAIWYALEGLGNATLAHVLSEYGGGLAALVDEADRFALEAWQARPVDLRFLAAFFASTFGPDHHVVSLVRFHEVARSLRSAEPPPGLPAGGLALSHRAALVEGLQPVPALQRLVQAGTRDVPDALRDDRAPWLVFVDDPAAPGIGACRLRPAQAELVGMLARGTTPGELREAAARHGEPAHAADGLVDRLVALGLVGR